MTCKGSLNYFLIIKCLMKDPEHSFLIYSRKRKANIIYTLRKIRAIISYYVYHQTYLYPLMLAILTLYWEKFQYVLFYIEKGLQNIVFFPWDGLLIYNKAQENRYPLYLQLFLPQWILIFFIYLMEEALNRQFENPIDLIPHIYIWRHILILNKSKIY